MDIYGVWVSVESVYMDFCGSPLKAFDQLAF